MFYCPSRSKISCLLIACLSLCSFINPCISTEQTKYSPLKIGVVLVGPKSDWGWNYAQNQGRLYLESKMQGLVRTTLAENIPENAEVERVLERMIAQGNKLIFATAYGYLEPVMRVAARHPDVTFMQVGRTRIAKNIGTYCDLRATSSLYFWCRCWTNNKIEQAWLYSWTSNSASVDGHKRV